jgi:glycosyltransferase involved in cell wall biosynthesis
MKILMLADVFFPDITGGAGRVAHYLCLELSKKGHEVHIITRNINGSLASRQQLNTNFFIHRFIVPQNGSSGLLLLSEARNSYILAKKLAKEISFDLVCVHQSMAAIGPLLSGLLRGIPIYYCLHSPWHEEYLIKRRTPDKKVGVKDRMISLVMKTIEKRILLKSKKVVVLSKYMGRKVSQTHGYPQERIRVIPGGVDLDRFHLPLEGKKNAKQDLDVTQDRTIFFTLRNLVPRMGIESLIGAFNCSETLREKSLLLIGGSGFLENRLKEMVGSSNLKNSILFLGHVPDQYLPGIYQAADYFVLPTEELEGFGLVILEAMACGTPVLGTPVGAIPEIIGPFDERLIFKGTNWKDIKEKMEDIIARPDLYYFDPKACRKFVEENYSWKKVADDFEEVAIGLIT